MHRAKVVESSLYKWKDLRMFVANPPPTVVLASLLLQFNSCERGQS
jgi:hypothetical protein